MKVTEILKELDKLGIEFKPGDAKGKLQSKLTRAQNKLAKETAKETKEVVKETKKVKPAIKKPVFFYGPLRKEIVKFKDLGNGETKVFFGGSIEVIENAIFKANLKEE